MLKLSRRARTRAPLAVALVLALAAAACGSSSPSAENASSTGTDTSTTYDFSDVKIVYGGQNGGVGPLAEASGAFKDAPYKVEWANLSTSTGVLQGLLSGAVTIGGFGDVSLTLAQAGSNPAWTAADIPLKAVAVSQPAAAVDTAYPPFQLLIKKGSNIKTLADLKGKKIAYAPGGTINKFLFLILKKAGLSASEIQGVQLASPVGATALINGDVDAWIGNVYFVPAPVAAGAKVIATSNDAGIETPNIGVQAVPTSVLKDPKKSAAIGDFLARYWKMQYWIETHPTEAAQAYVTYLKSSPETADLQAKTPSRARVFDKDLLAYEQLTADTLLAGGLITTKVDTSLQYDDRYNAVAEKAIKELYGSTTTTTKP